MSMYYDSISKAVIVSTEAADRTSSTPPTTTAIQHSKLDKQNSYILDHLKKDSIQFASKF